MPQLDKQNRSRLAHVTEEAQKQEKQSVKKKTVLQEDEIKVQTHVDHAVLLQE